MPYTWGDNNSVKNGISSFLDQLFAQNPSLNFLSQSTTYSTQYPEALVLSDQATTIACALMFCFNPTPNFTFACRAKPSAQINDSLYQV
uniref:Uncharacterized protein n=1 Tax=Panagrolaimus superbus TaxID=310955 RepID=A0A914YHT1_9BILA